MVEAGPGRRRFRGHDAFAGLGKRCRVPPKLRLVVIQAPGALGRLGGEPCGTARAVAGAGFVWLVDRQVQAQVIEVVNRKGHGSAADVGVVFPKPRQDSA
jgi:hypothetical protein